MIQTKKDSKKNKAGIYGRFFKRPMDFMLSLLAIILLSPLLIITAILVRIKMGSPVIYKQKRPGLNEKIFTIYKFRTMTDKKDSEGNLLPDGERLTSFGRFIRSTSLDELPELFNILNGDMSIIGPRPLAIQYLPYYTQAERIRHSVRPGLSGLAQVKGRNIITWEERFRYDIYYVKNISFYLDFIIIVKSILAAFRRADVGERGVDTPMDFDMYRKNEIEKSGV